MSDSAVLFKGNSSRLQLLIEKIQANKENHNVSEQDIKDALGTEGASSWSSEGRSSPPSTPNSATDLADSDLAFTVGVTDVTPYPCQFCEKAFPRLSYLKKHEQSHCEHLPFICEFCKRRFKHKRSKDRHLKLHTGDKRYKCTHCQAAFARSDHLKIHMKTHDNQKPFQCTVCNRGYNTAAALTSHMQNHKKTVETEVSAGGSLFKCLECSEVFVKPEDLTSHMTNEHENNESKKRSSTPSRSLLTCIYCTKDNFTSIESLQLHVQAMHASMLNGGHPYNARNLLLVNCLTNSGFPCRLCTMVFPSAVILQAHALAAHGIPDAKTDIQCPHCRMTFFSINSFAEHYFSMHGAPLPKAKGPIDQILPTDLTVVRRDQDDKPTVAKKSRYFPAAPDINRNVPPISQYDHQGVLLCNQCNAALPDFESFRNHLKSHLEESSFLPMLPLRHAQPGVCPYCGVHFTSPEDVARHIGSHFVSVITEYGCQSCYKLYTKSDDLQKHLMEMHTHHLYKCVLCKDLFESKVAIQVHFAVKHCSETKQYKCTICPDGPTLHSEIEFNLHVRTSHCNFSLPSPKPACVSPPRVQRCIFCNMTFNTEIEMQFHLSVHTKQFQCTMCPEAFHVEYLLDKHIQLNHPGQHHALAKEEESRDSDRPLLNGYSHSSGLVPASTAQSGNSNSSSSADTNKKMDSSHPVANNNNNNNNPSGVCDLCETGEFSSEAELSAHRKLVHHIKTSSKVTLHCAYCKENCKSRSDLETHMKSHCQAAAGASKHKCNICDEICLSAAVLAEHKLNHCKVMYGSTCVICKVSITNEESFIRHIIQHSNTPGNGQQLTLPVACVICRRTLSTELETRLHAKFHLQMEVAQCSMCLQSSDRGLTIDGLCGQCNSAAKSPPLKCSQCYLKFETLSLLETHYIAAHKNQISKEDMETETAESHEVETRCRLCSIVLPSASQLQIHLIEHTFAGCSTFSCYICSAVFTTAVSLQNHIMEHGPSARPYDCSKCSLKFFFRAELDNHSFSHSENSKEIKHSYDYQSRRASENDSARHKIYGYRRSEKKASRAETPPPAETSGMSLVFSESNEVSPDENESEPVVKEETQD